MSDRATVNVVCAKAPRRVGCVPAVQTPMGTQWNGKFVERYAPFICSFCGARVKVVA